MIQLLLSEPGVSSENFRSLRKLVYGGSPISETLLEKAIRIMQCEFSQIYGLTETGNCAVCLPPSAHQIGGNLLRAAGRPYPGFEVKIVGKNGVLLPSEKVGEICIKTPARMLEYWKRPADTKAILIDNWIFTGDIGYLNDEGYLYVHDRLKEMIIVAGENVYPAEVENALCKIPQVLEAAVIGVPDEYSGESIFAFVVLRPGQELSARSIRIAMKELIANYKIPIRFEFLEQVPRNPSGKILRRVLRDRFWAGRSRQVN